MELLSRGIELYLRGDSYYSALHLAGAAEEVLAVYVRELPVDEAHGRGSASDQLKQAFLALSESGTPHCEESLGKWFHDQTYAAKNSVKHRRGRSDRLVDFDPKLEAAELLELAVSTYFQLFSRTQVPTCPASRPLIKSGVPSGPQMRPNNSFKPKPLCGAAYLKR
ncbi:hypothetical protein GW15_0219385 [Xanthomonas axonopodis pv. vasculorum]|uniref:Uncharacterized protein n=1 Tax=Xanthomonas axonopodis pv. vasculorum TaxID=325777 RepID=A0A098PU81_9XANT|nr:hypothetical protein GW15_0219385 [Xanthomonas axonopodis pv. vasculorum]PPV10593.1 hypothetical protein XavaCFBP5823_07615 [Xanthomonas axonopodis pv. vasculorum]QKD86133.1 hypothetical protein XAV_06570 [Xanthomonas axonopodis pv. vasculorum]